MPKIKGSEGDRELRVYETTHSIGFTRVELREGQTLTSGWFNTADLLAALDAVPRDNFDTQAKLVRALTDRAVKAEAALAGSEECRLVTEKKLAEAEAGVEAWKHTVSVLDDELSDAQELLGQRAGELHKARAERDALAATVERVREVTEDYRVKGNDFYIDVPFRTRYKEVWDKLTSALDPEPAFVLPTEAGAEFWASRDGREERFITYSSGDPGDCLYAGRGGIETTWSINENWTITRLGGAE